MEPQAHKKRSNRQFKEGDWFFPEKTQFTMSTQHFSKILYCLIFMALTWSFRRWELLLTNCCCTPSHNSCLFTQALSCYSWDNYSSTMMNMASLYCPQLVKVLDRKMIQKGNKVVAQLRIRWAICRKIRLLGKDVNTLKVQFPAFHPWLKDVLEVVVLICQHSHDYSFLLVLVLPLL